MNINPYLFLEGRCEEAIEFYTSKIGAKTSMLMRFKDAPPPDKDAECGPEGGDPHAKIDPNKVMHAEITIGTSTVLLSDGRCESSPKFEGFGLALYAADDAEANKLFDALGDGGMVCMPLMKSFFASSFGMVKDKFGVMWMILAGVQK